ncbi:Secretory lipase [Nocardia farcinica]|uniref:Secretory lipase n=1 Tax=Nocardia farcinica TaxID=37329 RepID=A0A0H5P136_NOCFR|nr:lipase family protein [Nocardia farcinica]AXK85065.1 lipase [Nocardia farcinica]CRY76141.1 Secretory lipase [Nocardia farcinica]SIS74262.1 Secretory lipase [Nocardia farcinica]
MPARLGRRRPAYLVRSTVLVAAAIALVCTVFPVSAGAAPNLADPFYAPPPGYEATAPGTILRTRAIDVGFFQAVAMQVDGWQVLYRTTRADGSPYSAVTTVLKPRHGGPPAALLSFQNMTDAVAPHCVPSQALQRGAVPWLDPGRPGPVTLTTMAAETPLVAAALARGWVVSVPDYGGVDNHFLAAREPGYVVLDGIRATAAFGPTGLPGPDTRALLWGYSGGGIATGWAAQEQPGYAPELTLAGAALGAPVGDFRAGIATANGKPVDGALLPVALMGMAEGSAEFAAALNRYLTPAGQEKVRAAAAHCTPQNLLANLGFDASAHLTVPLAEVFADPVISAAVDAAELGSAAPTAPLYVYNAVGDDISTIDGVGALVDAYCRAGTAVTFRQEQLPMPVSAHTVEWGLGAPGALAWLEQRAHDSAVPSGCDIRAVPATLLAPEALDALGSGIIAGSMRQLLGF